MVQEQALGQPVTGKPCSHLEDFYQPSHNLTPRQLQLESNVMPTQKVPALKDALLTPAKMENT